MATRQGRFPTDEVNAVTAAHPPADRRARRHRRLALVALLVAVGVTVAGTSPAGAQWPWLRQLVERVTPIIEPVPEPEPSVTEPCGGSLPTADGGTWECTFSDEFSGTELDRTKWVPQQTATSGFAPGGACFVDDPANVSVGDGVLKLTARKRLLPMTCRSSSSGSFRTRVTSGSVSTFGKFSQTYGRFAVRAKFPATKVKGLQEAIWLWPDDPLKYGPWPHSGEIDIAEVYSVNNDRAIPFIHYAATDYTDVTNNYCLLNPAQFHTYVAEWTETSIRILFDGVVCIDHEIAPVSPLEAPQPFDHPFMVALTQALGVGTNAWTTSTPMPATTEVDYVRVWAASEP